jgi:hypothetical protein
MEELKKVMNMLAEDKPLHQKNVIILLLALGWVIENVMCNRISF